MTNDTITGARAARAGFTLIELMVVIVMMGLLAGIILGIAGFATRQSDEAATEAMVQRLRGALQEYQIAYGTYPVNDISSYGGWMNIAPDLTNRVADLEFEDSWGRPFQYRTMRRPGQTAGRVLSYDLWSWGPSGPGADNEHDIIR